MEQTFFKWLGFDSEKEVWNIDGDGKVAVSVIAKEHLRRFTVLDAAIMASQESNKVPGRLITKTFHEYAETRNKIKIVGKPLKANEDWEVKKHSIPTGMVWTF